MRRSEFSIAVQSLANVTVVGASPCLCQLDVSLDYRVTGVFDGTASDRGLVVRERAGGRGGRPAARRSAFVLWITKGGGVSNFDMRPLSGGLTGWNPSRSTMLGTLDVATMVQTKQGRFLRLAAAAALKYCWAHAVRVVVS